MTHHYNNFRTGSNTSETLLNTNINSHNFGALFDLPVNGQIYAQPLIACSLDFGEKGVHDTVFLCTASNNVYAYDANGLSRTPLWSRNLGPPIPYQLTGDDNIIPVIGIIGTPVIDILSDTMYVVASTYANGRQAISLHALDILTGAERPYSPVAFQATVPGTGVNGDGTYVTFDPALHINRPGLLLDHGRLYVAFGSHGDANTWHGWVFAMDPRTLATLGVYCSTSDGEYGGIWMGGNGLVSDDEGNIYFQTGNGDFTTDGSGGMTGNSMVRLTYTDSNLQVSDFFTPSRSAADNTYDLDFGAGAPILMPGTHYLFGAGKDGYIYLVDSTNMGKYDASVDSCKQSFHVFPGKVHSSAFWVSPEHGPVAYFWAGRDHLRQFRFLGSKFQPTPALTSTVVDTVGHPGGSLSISSNGARPHTGIVWSNNPINKNPDHATVTGILYAFDADDLSKVLWTSEQNHYRDSLGFYAKFTPPVVANGKVYMATFGNKLIVYGLLGAQARR